MEYKNLSLNIFRKYSFKFNSVGIHGWYRPVVVIEIDVSLCILLASSVIRPSDRSWRFWQDGQRNVNFNHYCTAIHWNLFRISRKDKISYKTTSISLDRRSRFLNFRMLSQLRLFIYYTYIYMGRAINKYCLYCKHNLLIITPLNEICCSCVTLPVLRELFELNSII